MVELLPPPPPAVAAMVLAKRPIVDEVDSLRLQVLNP